MLEIINYLKSKTDSDADFVKIYIEYIPCIIEALEQQYINRCTDCEYECRPGDEEPCASCSNNYVNKWTQANWQE